ncbi:multicomponent Na+:H+ antiporter subunit E [Rhodobium orientis]|uniref:Na+/H+ antiporter subunit E n=2 Tax=Rhodobium TaxID=34016 RepID=A0A327JRU1_9HYPH|nr:MULTISPECIES: Na+/H+ antiporter subunit E [Rhodobium]MBB4303796.1 multicomponent Na+:H+ antiporter subunit E [Rhodobium orientis]MBK5947914.1 Na+/H+ antiporter subunit E [Rhodobium orientis]MCW2307922.1 multicomponent Na+:H+ antiporter subunit E [Rhodobium gokarnense]RAI26078.1 Na+/H+ antiporter subunit E [Rhodobium orientis]
MIALYLINILLAIMWAAVGGSFTLVNILFGFALGSLALLIIREQAGTVAYVKRSYKVVALALLFLYELVLSALKVARVVLSPKMRLSPGIFAYPLTIDRDFEITLLANLITLTPGTLSVDVSDDRKVLYVHALDIPDVDAAIADIRNGFERKIMEAFR